VLSWVYANRIAIQIAKLQRIIRRTEALYALIAQRRGDEGGVTGTDWARSTLDNLVARFNQIDGYRCLSLMRAPAVVNCQSALAWLAFDPPPRRRFLRQGFVCRDAAIEATGTKDAELRLRHIEPTAMLWSVMPFETARPTACFGAGKALVERGGLVGV